MYCYHELVRKETSNQCENKMNHDLQWTPEILLRFFIYYFLRFLFFFYFLIIIFILIIIFLLFLLLLFYYFYYYHFITFIIFTLFLRISLHFDIFILYPKIYFQSGRQELIYLVR